MATKFFTFLITAGAALSWLGWFLLLFNINPEKAGFFAFFAFYCSMFLALSGTIFFLGKFLRRRLSKRKPMYLQINISLRQAFLFATLVVAAAILQSHRLLNFWNGIVLVLIMAMFEFFFIVYSRQRHFSGAAEE